MGGGKDARAMNEAAKWWLVDYMTEAGGDAPAKDGLAAAEAAGFTESQITVARKRVGVTTKRDGYGPGRGFTWRLDLSIPRERPAWINHVMACERPTAKYPDGRTGTSAGYHAHRNAGEQACRACTDAFSAESLERRHSLPPGEAERERQLRNEHAANWREREREAGRANAAEYRYRDRQRALGLEYVARDKFMATSREIIREAKNAPCADCGVRYPYYVMQFDHLGDKDFNIGHIGPTCSRAKLMAEIAKCEVVCSNCHAERTHQRRQVREAS
jgi:hypothetical protein